MAAAAHWMQTNKQLDQDLTDGDAIIFFFVQQQQQQQRLCLMITGRSQN